MGLFLNDSKLLRREKLIAYGVQMDPYGTCDVYNFICITKEPENVSDIH